MDCEQALNLIAINMAGELPSDDRAHLDEHLNGCASCRATSQAWLQHDVELRGAFAPRRAAATALAERVITQVRTLPLPRRRRSQAPWFIIPVLSAAAGFLLAVLVLPPWLTTTVIVEKYIPNEPEKKAAPSPFPESTAKDEKDDRGKETKEFGPVAEKRLSKKESTGNEKDKKAMEKSPPREKETEEQKKVELPAMPELKLANGPVETGTPDAKDWRELEVGRKLIAGCSVRTPPSVKCDFRCPDGCEFRLNGDTEVVFQSERELQLKRGQLWSNVPPAKESREPVQIHAAGATIQSTNGQFDVKTGLNATELTVAQGKAEVLGGNVDKKADRFEVLRGQVAQIVNGEASRVKQPSAAEMALATKWATDALVRGKADDPEIDRSVLSCLSQIGDLKQQAAFENQLRAYGEFSAPPLARYLKSDGGKASPKQRESAARILSDLAPSWAIPDLIELLKHPDADVRFYAATGLKRLTGQTHGVSPEEWRAPPAKTLKLSTDDCYHAWKRWWAENKDRYPPRP
jgi:hypothetical protein